MRACIKTYSAASAGVFAKCRGPNKSVEHIPQKGVC
jgi:hypothetical protein